MDRIKWRNVLLVILAIALLAHSRAIGQAIGRLGIGEMWREFADRLWSGPSAGRFVIVALALFLIFITVYTLLLTYIRQKTGKRE